MSIHRPSPFVLPLLSVCVLGAPAAAGESGSGYCHLTPWHADPPQGADMHGRKLAAGDELLALQSRSQETVLVYERQGSAWVVLDEIENPGLAGFGTALDVDGSRLAVASEKEEHLAEKAGRVYLYERVGDEMQLVQTFEDPTPEAYDYFGSDVQLTAHWLAIGAYGGDTVHTFRELDGSWIPVEEIGGPAGSSWFGHSLAMVEVDPGEAELYVGDPLFGGGDGIVHNYRLSPGAVEMDPPLFPSGVTEDGYFGTDIDYDGERVVVAAKGDTEFGTGAAYVFDAPLGIHVPVMVEKLFPDSPAGENFAYSVALSGSRVLVGATGFGTYEDSGAVFVFGDGLFGGVVLQDVVEPALPAANAWFGMAVAGVDDGFVASAPFATVDGSSSSGAVYYVSLKPGAGWSGACPSDALADAEPYGSGKPGTLGVPQLDSTVPVPGAHHTLTLKNVPSGALPVLAVGLVPGAFAFDGGTFLVADPHFVGMPAVGVLGQVGLGWIVPGGVPALYGLDLYAQALLVDPGADGEYQTAQSNGVHMRIGF